jgi:hypothetical protein
MGDRRKSCVGEVDLGILRSDGDQHREEAQHSEICN